MTPQALRQRRLAEAGLCVTCGQEMPDTNERTGKPYRKCMNCRPGFRQRGLRSTKGVEEPHLDRQAIPDLPAWWVGLDRAAFTAQVHERFDNMTTRPLVHRGWAG